MTTREIVLLLAVSLLMPLLVASMGCNALFYVTVGRMEAELLTEKEARLKALRDHLDTARKYEAYRKRMGDGR